MKIAASLPVVSAGNSEIIIGKIASFALGSSLLHVKGTFPRSSDNAKLKFAKKIGNEGSGLCMVYRYAI